MRNEQQDFSLIVKFSALVINVLTGRNCSVRNSKSSTGGHKLRMKSNRADKACMLFNVVRQSSQHDKKSLIDSFDEKLNYIQSEK